MPNKLRRIYHHYQALEETSAGMWRRLNGDERRGFVEAAADLMRAPEEFLAAMRQAIIEWPRSCEHNLTADGTNFIAYLGHAGCCVGCGSPEECTRVAWHTLSKTEQEEANRVAAVALSEWREKQFAQNQLDLFHA